MNAFKLLLASFVLTFSGPQSDAVSKCAWLLSHAPKKMSLFTIPCIFLSEVFIRYLALVYR